MNHIYLVKSTVGEYDDRSERSLCAVTTEEKAKTLVQQFIELNQFNCAFETRKRNEFTHAWHNNHPRPEAPMKPKTPEGFHLLQNLLSIRKESLSLKTPQSSSFISLSQDIEENKKSFKALQDQHHANLKSFNDVMQAYHKVFDQYQKDFKIAEQEWFDKNYILPSHLNEVNEIADKENHYYSYSDIKYTYYKLDVIH